MKLTFKLRIFHLKTIIFINAVHNCIVKTCKYMRRSKEFFVVRKKSLPFLKSQHHCIVVFSEPAMASSLSQTLLRLRPASGRLLLARNGFQEAYRGTFGGLV